MLNQIWLCHCPEIDINHNHTPLFSTRENQYNFFEEKRVYLIEENYYLRRNSNIKINKTIKELELCDYMMYYQENEDKPYYYFVADKQYVNEHTTLLVLVLDVIQTYMFDYNLTNCYVERRHCSKNDTSPFLYEEQLFTGEYFVKDKIELYDYTSKGGYIITSSDRLGVKSGGSSLGPNGSSVTIGSYPYNDSISEARNARFSKIWIGVKEGQIHGLFPSVTYAQYVLECGWDGSTLSEQYNNAFGIKADASWVGEKVALTTWEDYGSGPVEVVDYFRVYDNINDSVKDRTQFLLENSNYVNAGVFTASTYQEQCQALKNAGYATDPDYPSKLIEIIESNNFTIYDNITDVSVIQGDEIRSNIIATAQTCIGQPYVWGGESFEEGGFDCSGLCDYAYRQNGLGSLVPGRWTTTTMFSKCEIIEISDIKPGDFVFMNYDDYGNLTSFYTNPSHVCLIAENWANDGCVNVIEASQPGTNIAQKDRVVNELFKYGRLLK